MRAVGRHWRRPAYRVDDFPTNASAMIARAVAASMALRAADETAEPPPRESRMTEKIDLLVANGAIVDPGSASSITADVAINRGIIVDVGEQLQKRFEPTRLIDARDEYIIPGLADMHTHFGTGMRPPDEDDTAPVLARLLYYGVTTTLNLGSFQAWPGRIDALRSGLRTGAFHGPRLLAVGALITVPGSHPTTTIYPPRLQAKIAEIVDAAPAVGPIDLAPETGRATTLVRTAEDMRAEVKRVGDWGADAIKIVVESGPPLFGDDHPQMSSALISAAVEAAGPYRIPVMCHVSSIDALEACLASGASCAAHAVVSAKRLPEGIEGRMAAAGMALIPTASMFEGWLRYPADPSLLDDSILGETLTSAERDAHRSDEMLSAFARRRSFVEAALPSLRAHIKAAKDAGVLIIAGTDTANPYRFPGYGLHEELAFYVSAGLTPREALATATVNAARLVGAEREWGSIREGLAADLVVLGANPLEDISNTRTIRHVIRAGHVVERARLPVQ
jgi:imidazolonepropionase-like amidohydrolase